MMSVLHNKHAEFDFNCSSSLQQQSTCKHGVPLGHITMPQRQLVLGVIFMEKQEMPILQSLVWSDQRIYRTQEYASSTDFRPSLKYKSYTDSKPSSNTLQLQILDHRWASFIIYRFQTISEYRSFTYSRPEWGTPRLLLILDHF